MLDYSEVIETQGVSIPFDPRIITPKIEKPMRSGRYEGGECSTLRRILRPGDRVLELGAGLGLCSTVAAQAEGVASVTTIEANPALVPLIRETHRLNGVADRVDLRHGVATPHGGEAVPFYVRPDFWASSMDASAGGHSGVAIVPAIGLDALMGELRPTVLVCDIEGGELGLFDNLDLSSLRAVVLELHPKVYGTEGTARICCALAQAGLLPAEDNRHGSTVQLFLRAEQAKAAPARGLMPVRDYRPWPIPDPRILIVTCMKDEGPFLLEWLAWHRALGVTDFVVFTNDCSDGTDRMLDRLAERGEVIHLPNPARAANSTAFQPVALNYAHFLPVFREADFVISMDVDEFLNIRAGAGRLVDLFAATGPFDALSISELNHGCNGQRDFRPGWQRDLFPAHQTETPGKQKARRGVKTITRLSPLVDRIRNHRPDMVRTGLPVRWLDGSGRHTDWFQTAPMENGMDVRGSYALAVLDHYPLRSLGSFLAKAFRGDVVVEDKRVSLRYWRQRNRNEQMTSRFNPDLEAAARAYHRDRFASDPQLMALDHAAAEWHGRTIARLMEDDNFAAERDWIIANGFGDAASADADADAEDEEGGAMGQGG